MSTDASAHRPDAAAPPPLTPQMRAQLAPMLAGTLLERCGMELVTLDATGGTATMPVAGNTQPAGLLHGGATIAVAETIASFAAMLRAREVHGEGAQAVGTSVSALHHRSAREGLVTATASVRQAGRQIAAYLVEVHDGSGMLLSTVTVQTMLLPPRRGSAGPDQPGASKESAPPAWSAPASDQP